MIKTKNKIIEVVSSSRLFDYLVNSSDIPITVRFKLAVLHKELKSIATVYLEEKEKTINKYIRRSKDGKVVVQNGKIAIDNVDKMIEDMKELMEVEIDLNVEIPSVDIKFLEDWVSAKEMGELADIIDFIDKE